MNEEKFLLQILLTAKYSQTISELANKLFVSQPYVSRALKKAENQYGLTFINRNVKPIQITAAGRLFTQNLQGILDAQKEMEQDLSRLQQQEAGTLTIAINQPFLANTISAAIVQAHQAFPELHFRVISQATDSAENHLIRGELDILIGRKWNNPIFSIHTLPSPQLDLLLPETCPLYRPDRIFCPFSEDNLSSLNNCDYVGLSDHSLFQKQVNTALHENGISINEILEFTNIQTATQVALQLHATTVTTAEIAQSCLSPQDKYNLMPFPVEFLHSEFALSHLKSATPTIKKVSHFLTQVLNQPTLAIN
ncbi:LysR substrate-binding domain-containing protein [Levilactobacillus lanxiensis]|uniref:LysR substrate-binding domain-containing protein n=1 Tax=Levilactobacillus lanxiensis TaxID=2799568 RepID=A0ABW4D9C0_9LACO|nr:LysR family transcriptional regulator [Levilactobacillus lanxiensis]